jgi:hypothetical protein
MQDSPAIKTSLELGFSRILSGDQLWLKLFRQKTLHGEREVRRTLTAV